MGSIYPRGNLLWLAFVGADGRRRLKSSGLLIGNEKEARAVLTAIERQVQAEIRLGDEVESGPPTVGGYAKRFVRARRSAGVGSASQEESRFRDYINPFEVDGVALGSMLLKDVRPHHVRDLLRHLRTREPRLAPRTVRHIYGHLRTMFHEAVTDELVSATPCVIKKGELPKKVDKDPAWRARAVFSRDEVELLLSDERIAPLRRVRYAALFLTGMRIGELSERRWRDLSASEPLDMLSVATSYSRKEKRVKSVKTERPRLVPAHPTLSKVLAAWRLTGWAAEFGRVPKADDLMCPSATGGNLRDTVVLKEFHADCQTVGIRIRRVHDTRRTFISLCLADGANKDILRQVTHGSSGDQVDQYTTLPWATLCAEVSKLKIKLLEGKLLSLPVAGNSGDGGVKMPLQSLLQSQAVRVKSLVLAGRSGPSTEWARRDSNPHHEVPTSANRAQGAQESGELPDSASSTRQETTKERSNVAAALSSARAQWLESGDKEALRAALLEILGEVAK